jgi:hypothetical protein
MTLRAALAAVALLATCNLARAERVVSPTDRLAQGTLLLELRGSYARTSFGGEVTDATYTQTSAGLELRGALFDGITLGVEQGFLVYETSVIDGLEEDLGDRDGLQDLAISAEALLRHERVVAGGTLVVWLPSGKEELSNDEVAVDLSLLGAFAVSDRVEVFAILSHLYNGRAADRPDTLAFEGGVNIHSDRWSLVPRFFLLWDSPLDRPESDSPVIAATLLAGFEATPGLTIKAGVVSRHRSADTFRDRGDFTTIGVSVYLQGALNVLR